MLISLPLVGYVLKAAVRDRLFLSLVVLVVIGTSLSIFLGSAAIVEADRFALVFAASGLRLAGVVGLVLFVVFYLRRSFDHKDVEYLLSRSVSRTAFLLSHALALSVLALFMTVLVCGGVFAVAPHLVATGYVLWSLSLLVEFIIMAFAALFFAMVLSSPTTAALATLALYVLARIIGQILGIIDEYNNLPIMERTMEVISMVVPRLDLLAQSSWLVYGDATLSPVFVMAQGLFYGGLLIAAALFDLKRRQF
ncbi:MAG: hypothetical protein H6868_06015 [Rhodospirillales bacterium]|nr:hypothetical protein [Rhodospirillales bacterium]